MTSDGRETGRGETDVPTGPPLVAPRTGASASTRSAPGSGVSPRAIDSTSPASSPLRRFVHAALRATSHLVPEGPLASRWIALPSFVAFHGRWPRDPDDPRALYRDFLYRTMLGPFTAEQRRLVDKIEAKPRVAQACPDLQVARTVAVLDVDRRIGRDDLERFLRPHLGRRLVAKPAHASGLCVFLDRVGSDDLDRLLRVARGDYFLHAGEAQYRGLRRRILVEESLADDDGNPPTSWRFACTRGIPWLGMADVHAGSGLHEHYFDLPSRALVHARRDDAPLARPMLEMPERLDEMIGIAARLSAPFEFVRVDLYATRDATWFGELTFTPLAARERFSDPELSRWLLARAMRPELPRPLPPHLQAAATRPGGAA